MGSIKIAPSILSADMANLKGDLDKIAGADYVHFDVMDGHFTGNLTFGVDILKAVKRSTDVPVDAHLMVSNPDETVDWYADAGADMITVHYEASTHLHRTLTHLQQRGVKAGVVLNPDAVFDVQVKRLHEYKRQQLNLLYLIHQYYEIKAGHLPAVPLVSIFGAKAAPAYTIAKDIIHALLTLSKVIAADPEVSKWLQVVFVENYNVTAAEKLIPACDLSEQISLASKEASGTGNMKFMLNGALTLGTMDGANVEISQQVGEENIYIFGQTSDQVIHRYAVGDYDPAQWVEGDANIRRAISFLTGPEMLAAGHAENLTRLHDELIHKDWFQTLPDFNAYVVRKGQALSDYACDPTGWRRKCLVNIAKAGMFSSDRTIAEYDRDIWHLGK